MAQAWVTITLLYTITSWLIPLIMLFIIPINRKPSSATAWLMLIFLQPYAGLLIFLLLGSPKLSRLRRAEQRTMDRLISRAVAEAKEIPELAAVIDPPIPSRYEPFVRLNANLGDLPAFTGNKVELLSDYNGIFERITEDIERAERFVHIEYFALSRDEETESVFKAMERAQKRGVKVRVLMDHIGSSRYPHFRKLRKMLTSAGIEHHLLLPLHLAFGDKYTRPDLRNHRKIVVIDGVIGYTGSQNLIRRNYYRRDGIYYDELVARVSGPIAAQLQAAFVTDWYSETGVLLFPQSGPQTIIEPTPVDGTMLCQVLPSGSAFQNENNLKLFTALIHAAQRKVVITNPYFVPDDSLMIAITSAAQRGVEVILINSETVDQFLVSHAERSYYEDLLRVGVKIYHYKAPVLLHSKLISVDDDIAVIGSSNLDMRSFQLNLEVSLVCYDLCVVSELRRIEAIYLGRSKQLSLAEWENRSLIRRLAESISRLTAALQ